MKKFLLNLNLILLIINSFIYLQSILINLFDTKTAHFKSMLSKIQNSIGRIVYEKTDMQKNVVSKKKRLEKTAILSLIPVTRNQG